MPAFSIVCSTSILGDLPSEMVTAVKEAYGDLASLVAVKCQ